MSDDSEDVETTLSQWVQAKLNQNEEKYPQLLENAEYVGAKDKLIAWKGGELGDFTIGYIIAARIELAEFLDQLPTSDDSDMMGSLSYNAEKLEYAHRESMCRKLLAWAETEVNHTKVEDLLRYLVIEPNVPDEFKTYAGFKLVGFIRDRRCSHATRHLVYMYALAQTLEGKLLGAGLRLILQHMVYHDMQNPSEESATCSVEITFKPLNGKAHSRSSF